MHKTSQIPSKMALGRGQFGARGGSPKKITPGGNWFFSDFLIIFYVAFFGVKI